MPDTPYSEYYKRRMNNQLTNHSNVNSNSQIKPLKTYSPYEDYSRKKHNRLNKLILSILISMFIIAFIGLVMYLPDSPISLIIISCFGILLGFIILMIFHKLYEHSIAKSNRIFILFVVYLLLGINMVLGTKTYSIEWAFLGFFIASVIIYDAKIDSRFLILPSLLLLSYIPFLLIGKFNVLAETIAIYVYYFLVCGVILQIIENIRKTENRLDFDNFVKGMLKEFDWVVPTIFTGLAGISAIIASRFYEIDLIKYTSIYSFIVCLIIYSISLIKPDNSN